MQHHWKDNYSPDFIIQYWNRMAREVSSFSFFSGINHFNHIILFGAIDYRLKLHAAGTTAKLSKASFCLLPRNWRSQLWPSGTTGSETHSGHRHNCPHFTSCCPGHPQEPSVPGDSLGEPLMASSPKRFTGSPLTHLGISQGTPSITKRSMKKGSLFWCSSLVSWPS